MAKKTSTYSINFKDILLLILSLSVIFLFIGYISTMQALQDSDKRETESWLRHQVQINKLKACVDEGTKPCEISPFIHN